jgi:dihydroorotase
MLITGGALADGRIRDVRIDGETIDAVASDLEPAADERVIDARGKHVLPGAIDVHVHFREPGGLQKETWKTGSRSAAAGGVTTVVDQPNTDPPTVDGGSFDAKAAIAAEDSLVDYGINGGVTAAWRPEELFDRPLFALGEVFLADSTGEMGIEMDRFEDALDRATAAGVPVTVHAEDADRFDPDALSGDLGGVGRRARSERWSAFRTPAAEAAAVERAVAAGEDVESRVHIAHTSTPEGIDATAGTGATCEVTPHHLFCSTDDCDRLGTFGRMNPPLRDPDRRAAVFDRLRDGRVDVVATDHAPHTAAEKDRTLTEAPSGVPGVETMLPLLLAAVRRDELTLERVRDVTARNPASIFGLEHKGAIEAGRDADLVVVDLEDPSDIRAAALHSKCRWTPFEGMAGVFPETTIVRGHVAYERDTEIGVESFGDPIGENARARDPIGAVDDADGGR